jgi:cytochrome oxidase Cu insertion factor (SCO1/SenC/PrrC family)
MSKSTAAAIVVAFIVLASLGIAQRVMSMRQMNGAQTQVSAENVDAGEVGDFKFTERSGRQVARDDLKGKVWVASFIFTCCTTQCPQITSTMAQLNQELADQPDVRLVTFTVDPERDTPEKLKEYADKHAADAQRWLFLTGDKEKLHEVLQKGFHVTAMPNTGPTRTPGNEFLHDFHLVLVDRQGHIRGYFDGRRTDEQGKPVDVLPRLKQRIAELVREAGD